MSDGTHGTPAVRVLDDLLLDTKLAVPAARPSAVSRASLIDMARAGDRRVVGITAPAGYGKSTMLGQWALSEDRPVAWVSLDRFDDDPAALLGLLAAAYGRASGRTDLVIDVGGVGVSVLGRAAPRLASVFRTSPFPFVLMLDDLHELRAPACHDALWIVIAGIPEGSQFVAASRSEQPHLSRMRAAGDALELSTGDLALGADAAEQIFAHAEVPLSSEMALAVTERTEGWPVGLYLAAAIARASGDGPLAITGDDRYVADYLYREALGQLPEGDQRFLRRTAVLDQLCAPLCEAVVGESGAQATLRGLEESSSFLVPLDRRRDWYRYHGLFREFLLAELRRAEPGTATTLHARAADWYESNGSPLMAVEHLLNTDEVDRCVQLMTSLMLTTYETGQMSTVQRWLSSLGAAAVAAYPPLAVLAGWVAALTGQTASAAEWAAVVEAASFDSVPADGTASFESSRAMLRSFTCPSGPEQALADAELALAQEPTTSPWRDLAQAVSAEAHLLAGDPERAAVLFAGAAAGAELHGNVDILVVSESELALLAVDRGRWNEASDHVERALAAIEEHRMHDYGTSALAFAGAARLALHRGDANEAYRQLTQAMRTRPTCTAAMPAISVRLRLQLAKSYWAVADHTTARHLLVEIDDIMLVRPALGQLAEEVAEFRRVVTSSAPSRVTGPQPLTPAELRLLPYLQTQLTVGEIAERLFVSRNTIRTQVSAIYRKLGVSSRTGAVQAATTAGLLGG